MKVYNKTVGQNSHHAGSTISVVDGVAIVDGTRVSRLLQGGDGNTKLRKNSGKGFITAGLSLSPEKQSGVGNTCPHASPGCAAACLDHQGLASVFQTIRNARIAKTRLYYGDRELFLDMLRSDLERFQRKADRNEMRLAVRLNVFSDIRWEVVGIVQEFKEVQFYDYTKNPKRAPMALNNYHTTFSRSETNEADCLNVLSRGGNVAIAFADMSGSFTGNRSHLQRLPKTWNRFRVIDGDNTDLRFDDPTGRKHGYVVGLRLKTHSKAEREQAISSGFAVKVT